MTERRDELPQENLEELPEHEKRDAPPGAGGRQVDEATRPDIPGDSLPRTEEGQPEMKPDEDVPPVTRSG